LLFFRKPTPRVEGGAPIFSGGYLVGQGGSWNIDGAAWRCIPLQARSLESPLNAGNTKGKNTLREIAGGADRTRNQSPKGKAPADAQKGG